MMYFRISKCSSRIRLSFWRTTTKLQQCDWISTRSRRSKSWPTGISTKYWHTWISTSQSRQSWSTYWISIISIYCARIRTGPRNQSISTSRSKSWISSIRTRIPKCYRTRISTNSRTWIPTSYLRCLSTAIYGIPRIPKHNPRKFYFCISSQSIPITAFTLPPKQLRNALKIATQRTFF